MKTKQLWRFKFEGAWPTSVAFLGENRLAAGNRDGVICVWDLTDHPADAADATSADDGSADDAAKRDSAAEGADAPPVRQLVGHTNGISHLVSTNDGKRLISSSLDHTLRIWEADNPPAGKSELVLDQATRERAAKKLPQEKRQEFIDAPGVTLDSQNATTILEGHTDWVNALAINRDGNRIISGDARSNVIVWDLADAKQVSTWTGHAWNGIVASCLSPDGQSAIVSEHSYKRDDFDIPAPALKAWNVSDGTEQLDILKTHIPKLDAGATTYGAASVWRKFVKGGLIALDVSPDGKLIAVGQGGETDKGEVHLFDLKTGKLAKTMSGHRYGVCDVKFSADGEFIFSSGRDTTLRICQLSDGKEVAALGKERGGQFKDWLHALAISPNQTRVAAADIGGMIHVWELS